jgi:hypothetical protein
MPCIDGLGNTLGAGGDGIVYRGYELGEVYGPRWVKLLV